MLEDIAEEKGAIDVRTGWDRDWDSIEELAADDTCPPYELEFGRRYWQIPQETRDNLRRMWEVEDEADDDHDVPDFLYIVWMRKVRRNSSNPELAYDLNVSLEFI